MDRQSQSVCSKLPVLLSNFVDTFVDFVVGGQFLISNPTTTDDSTASDQSWAHRVTRIPPVDRLVAIGDIHGDLQKAREALRVAQVIDENDKWIGGKTTVVQVGDLLDRGGEELKVIYLLERLKQEAKNSGGAVIVMNGNHEVMNIEGDFRYATPAAMEEFKRWAEWYTIGIGMKNLCQGLGQQPDIFKGIPPILAEGWRARLAALRPGGPISSRFLAANPTVVIVGGSVFVHGGLLPGHVSYGLEKINEEVKDWIYRGKGRTGPEYLHGRDAVVWLRRYSSRPGDRECSVLEHALASIPGARRMVVGHTIQTLGINGACGNRVIRVDVGMSRGCIDGLPEVLEITGDRELRVLTSNPADQAKPAVNAKEEKPGLGFLLSDNGARQVEVKA